MSESVDKLIVGEVAPSIPAPRRQEHRWIFVLLLLGLVSTLVLTTLAGNAQTFALLFKANLVFVLCIVGAQTLRYVAMTISTRVLAEIVGMRVPFTQMFQVNVAAQAANRTFVGGAAGVLIRFAYFFKRGMHSGTYGAVEGIEGALGFLATCSIFTTGLAILLASGAASGFRWDMSVLVILGALALAGAVITLVRRRDWVERTADWSVRGVDRIVSRILRRSVYDPARVRGAVNDFYKALDLARRDPARVFISFLCCVGRLGCDAVALYFAFRALGYDAAPGQVMLIFVVSTSVSTIAAVPGQIGVMEGMLSLMSAAFGIPAPVAVGATLLYRLISFWLPIPFGYAFAWNLTRKGLL